VSTPGTCGGKPRLAGHRITVKHIVLDHQQLPDGAGQIEASDLMKGYIPCRALRSR
jgi:uncharacterized protein (DUF433 family)